MEKLTDMVREFKINRDKKIFQLVLNSFFNNHHSCKYCNGPIIYYDTYIKHRSRDIGGKSFKSKKVIKNNEYNLVVCEDCLTYKYPNYQEKNKSRVFNQMNKFTKYAFDISDDDYNYQKDLYVLTTKDSLISKYGESEGKKRWESYREKQAYTNSFEHKRKMYGWTEEDFNNYNRSRSVTLENLIERYGNRLGKEKWEGYVNKQKETKSKEYFIEKYSEEDWNKLCESKAHTYSNYIKWYGSEEIALEKIKERHNIWNPVSKSSQKYLKEFDKYLKNRYEVETYFHSINQEYMVITEKRNIYYLDYYIKDWNVSIEYNGDLFHANPKIYEENDTPIPGSSLTSKEIWNRDEKKLKTIEKERGIKIITIWESDLPEFEKLIEMINERRYERRF